MTNTSSLKKNLAFSFGYQLLDIILPLITAPYIARVLGANSLGIYSKTQAFAQYFFLFAMLGVLNYGNRTIARVRDDVDERSRVFWEIYVFQMFTGLISSALYIGYCFFFITEYRTFYFLQSVHVFSAIFNINWFCFGMERFRLTTLRGAFIRILSATSIFLLVKKPEDLWLYTLIIAGGTLISALLVWPFVIDHVHPVRLSWAGIRRHIKPNLVLFWPVIAISLYNVMDKLMLGYFSSNEEVAFYSNAEKIVTIPNTIILALDNVIMPRMSNLFAKKGEEKQIRYLMDNVMMFAMLMAAAMAFGIAGVSDVFAPWFYGKEFVRCGYFILLLSPIIVFRGWAGVMRTQFIIPTGRDKIYVWSLTAGAVVNLIINAMLIPSMNGVGAIIGTLAAEFTVCFLQFFWCRKDLNIRRYLIDGISFCLIGLVMFFVVEALSNVGHKAIITLLVQIACGGMFYVLVTGFYMVKIKRNPTIINQVLKILKIKYKFR